MRPSHAIPLALVGALLASGCTSQAAAPASRASRELSAREPVLSPPSDRMTMRGRAAEPDASPRPRPEHPQTPSEQVEAPEAVPPATDPTAGVSGATPVEAGQAADPVAPQGTTEATQAAAVSAAGTFGTPATLDAPRGLARPNGPLEVRIAAAPGHGPLTLQVLDRRGEAFETVTVVPGTVDLLPLAPGLAASTTTSWVQLHEDGIPVGAPLWITPLRSAPPVRTVRSIRASNQQPYQRVVGWGDRAIDPNDAETAAAMPGWTPADPVVTAGFRVETAVEALLHTTDGVICVGLAPDAAPATVENFLRLARMGFYDGTVFHRVVPVDREGLPFVVQGGDPTGTGDGGPGWSLALEPSDLRHDRGVLGMARGDDPHSAGSQFYIALGREGTARLDAQYCTFGFMLDGFATLDRIAQSEIGDSTTGRPRTPPRIERVELVPARPCVAGGDPHGRPAFVPAPTATERVRPAATGAR